MAGTPSRRRLNAVYWCQFFWPEISAPSRRLLDLGREWSVLGHDVSVVTGMPNHPNGVVPPEYRGRLAVREKKDGLKILRSWVYASPNDAGVRKLLGHLSFAASSLLLSGPRLKKPSVIIASSPTFFAAFSAWLVARLKGAAFVFEVRDLWPEIFVELGVLKPGATVRALHALADFLYARADAVVVVTESFKSHIAARGVPEAKIIVIPNGADVDYFGENVRDAAASRRQGLGLEGYFVVAYIGAQGVSHGLKSILDVANICRDEADVRFLFVGGGSQAAELERYCAELNLPNVLMLPQQPSETVREFYALADACLVPLRDVPLFETFVPSKMFEIMAAGRPIIGSVSGEARRILEASGCALLTDPEAPDAIASALRTLRSEPRSKLDLLGRRGQQYVREHYSRRVQAVRYADLLDTLVK